MPMLSSLSSRRRRTPPGSDSTLEDRHSGRRCPGQTATPHGEGHRSRALGRRRRPFHRELTFRGRLRKRQGVEAEGRKPPGRIGEVSRRRSADRVQAGWRRGCSPAGSDPGSVRVAVSGWLPPDGARSADSTQPAQFAKVMVGSWKRTAVQRGRGPPQRSPEKSDRTPIRVSATSIWWLPSSSNREVNVIQPA